MLSRGFSGGFPSDWPDFISLNTNAAIIFSSKDYALICSLDLNNSVIVAVNV